MIDEINALVSSFNSKQSKVEIYVLTDLTLDEFINNSVILEDDYKLLAQVAVVAALYLVFFLGSCSPIHCRCLLALTGILCIGIAYLSGFAICFFFGHELTRLHPLIPLLLLAIGVDDIFTLCSALD